MNPDDNERRARLGAAAVLLRRLIHDIKQPLNLIRVTAQDVRLDAQRQRLDPASLPAAMASIERAIDEAARFLDGLRALAASRTPALKERADVADACRAAAARVQRVHPAAAIEVELASGLPAVALRQIDLEQAVAELLDNGARAVGGQGPVKVAARRVADDVEIEVSDAGEGVPEEACDRIFAPFFTTRPGSAGIGLPLARALVAPPEGRIDLVASGHSGALFRIALPARC